MIVNPRRIHEFWIPDSDYFKKIVESPGFSQEPKIEVGAILAIYAIVMSWFEKESEPVFDLAAQALDTNPETNKGLKFWNGLLWLTLYIGFV